SRLARPIVRYNIEAAYGIRVPLSSSICSDHNQQKRYTMPSQPNHLEEILCRGHCSSIVEVRLLRFWEARTFKRGGELMGWICFSLCQVSFKSVHLQLYIYREAMQRSDDITINSTASVKRRGKGPIVVRKTYCSLLDPSLEEHTASSLCVSSSKVQI
ncbi:hypothetical protein HID58_042821, partial [Brassica napus]